MLVYDGACTQFIVCCMFAQQHVTSSKDHCQTPVSVIARHLTSLVPRLPLNNWFLLCFKHASNFWEAQRICMYTHYSLYEGSYVIRIRNCRCFFVNIAISSKGLCVSVYITWHFWGWGQLHYCIDPIKFPNPQYNLCIPHPFSSLPSLQSGVPSQSPDKRIHWPLLHRDAPLWQEAVQSEMKWQPLHTTGSGIKDNLCLIPSIQSCISCKSCM